MRIAQVMFLSTSKRFEGESSQYVFQVRLVIWKIPHAVKFPSSPSYLWLHTDLKLLSAHAIWAMIRQSCPCSFAICSMRRSTPSWASDSGNRHIEARSVVEATSDHSPTLPNGHNEPKNDDSWAERGEGSVLAMSKTMKKVLMLVVESAKQCFSPLPWTD